MHDGLVIRHANDLYNLTAAQLGIVSEVTKNAYRVDFAGAQGGTIEAGRTTDGRTQMYLAELAFYGESWDTSSLHDVITHEMMHGGGLGKIPAPWWAFGRARHDLAGFKDYNKILAACQ